MFVPKNIPTEGISSVVDLRFVFSEAKTKQQLHGATRRIHTNTPNAY